MRIDGAKNFYSLSYRVLPFVAFRINWAISFGCDSSDAWLAGSEIVVAFICFENMCSTAGGIMRSFSEIWYQVGSCFQAGGPDFSVKIDTLNGFCTTAMTSALAGLTS